MDKETKDKFLRKLMEESYEKLYIFISRGSVHKGFAEDVVQETFLEAYRKAELLMNHPNQMGWLYLTAKNKMMKLLSKSEFAYSLDDEEFAHYKRRAVKELKYEAVELEETLKAFISDEEYEMLRDYYLNGYSSEEVAEKYGIDKGVIRMRMSRLKKRLRADIIAGGIFFLAICLCGLL